MTPDSANLDLECAAGHLPKVAAIINWFGIYDVADVIDGPNRRAAAVRWFGSLPNRMEIAKRVSPMTYVRAGLPRPSRSTATPIPPCPIRKPFVCTTRSPRRACQISY